MNNTHKPPIIIGGYPPRYQARHNNTDNFWEIYEVTEKGERFMGVINTQADAKAVATALNGRREDVLLIVGGRGIN